MKSEFHRYSRQIMLPEFGLEGQQKLKAASVLMVGCGGLGSPILLYLTAAGVGTIGIMDDDKVSESNLQRQVLYSNDEINQPKTEMATKRLNELNPYTNIVTLNMRLSTDNALDIIKDYDLVIDGSDNFSTRYLINDCCVILNKPFVYGAVFKFEGQVSVFNYNDGPTYRCLFPEPPDLAEAPSCAQIGVLGIIPGTIGLLQATEAIKIITGIGEVLSGKLLTYDALSTSFNTFGFKANPCNKEITELSDYSYACNSSVKELNTQEFLSLQKKEPITILDIREKWEFEEFNIGGISVPFALIADYIEEIPRDKKVVVICQSGARSKVAVRQLQSFGFEEVYNLKNGILGL